MHEFDADLDMDILKQFHLMTVKAFYLCFQC